MLYEKLIKIQSELNAPKNKTNSFGKYNYRSCEDILEAVKPVLDKYKTTITVSDEIELRGDRYYVKSTATIYDAEDANAMPISAFGFAREENEKKGMDAAQLTGACSSYARKYALNGLLLIDDNKDADTNEYTEEQKNKSSADKKSAPATSSAASSIPAPDKNGNWICESCKKPVEAFTCKDGSKKLPKEIVEYSWGSRHKCLCYSCLTNAVRGNA